MSRVKGLATLSRAARAIASDATPSTQHRLPHAAPFTTFSSPTSQSFVQKIADRFGKSSPSVAGAVAGFSVAASSLAQDVHAKEPPRSQNQNFLPKDVVLYQYEACPFCNKVKGIILKKKK